MKQYIDNAIQSINRLIEKSNNPKLVALLIAVSAISAFALPHYGDENQAYDRWTGKYITPHTAWANPLSGGKIKALMILPYHMTREAVEISERLDLEMTIIMTAGWNVRAQGYREGGSATPLFNREADEVVDKIMKERLLDRSKKYDLIFLGKLSWEIFKEQEKQCLYDRVKDGAGLVWFSPHRTEEKFRSKKIVNTPDSRYDELIGKYSEEALAGITRGVAMDSFPLEMFSSREAMEKKFPHAYQNRRSMTVSPCFISSGNIGKGRTAIIDFDDGHLIYSAIYRSITMPIYRPVENSTVFDYAAWDASFALASRAALYVTGRDGKGKVAFELPKTVKRNDKNLVKVQSKGGAKTQYFVREYTRKHDALEVNWQDIKDDSFKLPVLAAGDYLLGVRSLDGEGKVVDFAGQRFSVTADIEVKALTTDRDHYKEGDAINGKFELSRSPKAGENVFFIITDTWGRAVARGKAELAGAVGSFKAKVEKPLANLWDVSLQVRDAKGPVALKSIPIGIPKWKYDDYTAMLIFCPMPGNDGWKGDLYTEFMRKWGVNTAYSGMLLHGSSHELEANARAHIDTYSYIDHWGELDEVPDQRETVKKGIANTNLDIYAFHEMAEAMTKTKAPLDPKVFTKRYIGQHADQYNRKMKVLQDINKYGTIGYGVTGENYLSGEFSGGVQGMENSGFGPKTTREFQKWVMKEYKGDLAALNKEWNTSFNSFDEVKGIMLEEAVVEDQLPRWVDFRFFMRSEMWSGYFQKYDKLIHAFCDGGYAGFGGHAQHDFSKYRGTMMTSGKLYVSQEENWEWHDAFECEIRQSFSGDEGWWCGSQSNIRMTCDLDNEISRKRIPWTMMFMDLRGHDLENGLQGESLGGMTWTLPDYSDALPFFKDVGNEILRLERGIGKLFINSKPYRSKVAIDWSPRNHYISRLLIGRQKRGFSGSWLYNISLIDGAPNDALGLMNSLRMRPTIIAPEDDFGQYKALWLPYNKGMSEEEAAAILEFVKKGGLVLADNEPGSYTQHGRPRGRDRLLKKLFPDFSKFTSVTYGKGRAVYLAGALNSYPDRMYAGNYKGSDVVARYLEECCGETAPIIMKDEAGLSARNVRFNEHRRGGTRLAGFLRQHVGAAKNDVKRYELEFGDEYEVYDLYNERYLGRHAHLALDLDHYPAMLALTPMRTLGAKLKASGAVSRGGEVKLSLEVKFGKRVGSGKLLPADCWHLEITAPDGTECEFYRQNVLIDGDKTELGLPVAWNAQKGVYKVRMTSAVTKTFADCEFEVK